MSRKLLRDFAALLGGLQSPIVMWYNEKKEKEREKEGKKGTKHLRQESGCCILTTLLLPCLFLTTHLSLDSAHNSRIQFAVLQQHHCRDDCRSW